MFVASLDFQIERTPPSGEAVVRVEVGNKHRQVNGVVHGSVIHALLDTVMGLEAYRACNKKPVATAEISVRFLRPVFEGNLEARARVVKTGKRLIFLDGEVRRVDGAEPGQIVAIAQSTFAGIGGA